MSIAPAWLLPGLPFYLKTYPNDYKVPLGLPSTWDFQTVCSMLGPWESKAIGQVLL